MTTQEIKDLIASKIAGQGNQIDIAGALPKVLTAIAENAKFNKEATITVKVYGYKLNDNEDGFIANAGATGTVIVKGFSETGETLPVQEIPITLDDDGAATVEATANIGDTIGVMAKIDESGATCQMVQKVVGNITIPVESYPVGIWAIGDGMIEPNWDGDFFGTAIVSPDFALALAPQQREGWKTQKVQWGGMFQDIPFVMKAGDSATAITDFDGALNSAAILSVVNDGAARVALDMGEIYYTRINPFLPSAGMLKYLYDHKTEINNRINAAGGEPLPDLYFWSSTDYDPAETEDMAAYAWYADFVYGGVSDNPRDYSSRVLSVSAFQTRY